jgi:L-alanine-DL-glutamate epimerase-like enolase superfamily enzyme
MLIDTVTLYRFSLPLIQPYKLAMGVVEAFDTVLAVVGDGDGGTGFGEATILTGYTDETIDDCWRVARGLGKRIAGMEADEAKDAIQVEHASNPFTATALMTAVEMLEGHPLLEVSEKTLVPLLAIINAMDEDGIAEEIKARLQDGYSTLKVKVGFEDENDAKRVRFIQDHVGDRALIRLDGNQGYGLKEAVGFVKALNPDGIELFEQPCPAGDWDAAASVAEAAPVPMMLDESIYGPADIDRAADLRAASYIKLKLMKAGGLEALAGGLRQIRDRGMTAVLGNGVATDAGCWMEACVARGLIDNAGEMNGFLKPKTGLFTESLAVEGGAMVLPATPPKLRRPDTLSELATETAQYPES